MNLYGLLLQFYLFIVPVLLFIPMFAAQYKLAKDAGKCFFFNQLTDVLQLNKQLISEDEKKGAQEYRYDPTPAEVRFDIT